MADRRTVLKAILSLLEAIEGEPTVVVVAEGGKTYVFQLPPPAPAARPPPGAPPTRGCPGDIYRALKAAGRRLTCPEIVDAFAEAGVEWSERTIRQHLAEMIERGWIDHDPQAKPPGYSVATA